MEEAVEGWGELQRWTRGMYDGDMRVDLTRTWHRLMCHALVEVVVLDFRGTEVQRCGDEWKA